jgi:hypothetical protein
MPAPAHRIRYSYPEYITSSNRAMSSHRRLHARETPNVEADTLIGPHPEARVAR